MSSVQDPPVQVGHPHGGNLAGIPRIVRDNCAELYNAIQQWNDLVDEGAAVIRAITAITMKPESAIEQEDREGTSTDRHLVQGSCETLIRIHQYMGSLVEKMQLIASQFEALPLLSTTEVPLFRRMGLGDYRDSAKVIAEAYFKEHASKNIVAHEIARVYEEISASFLLTSWIYEPFIRSETTMKLEAMLLDSGHRIPLYP